MVLQLFTKKLSTEKLNQLEQEVIEATVSQDTDARWQAIQPLLKSQKRQPAAAQRLVKLVEDGRLSITESLTVLNQVFANYSDDPEMLALLGDATQSASDIDDLNRAPPSDPLFQSLIECIEPLVQKTRGTALEKDLLRGLATTARMMGRQQDELAKRSYERLVELDPQRSANYFNLGLFYKTRGQFAAGLQANQTDAALDDEPHEGTLWNIGICATGAGAGEVALDTWLSIEQKIKMGRFDLPDGSYPQCKVRLAEFPLAERGPEQDDPGIEETIWIERLSPCHGIVRSVLYQDLGVDYGDVVLMDGAPITYHKYGDSEVPVFPHLATLVHSDYQFYDFAGTQNEAGRIHAAANDLDADAVIYSHSENVRMLCKDCWRNPDRDHEPEHEHDHEEDSAAAHDEAEHQVVTGRIAAPPTMSPVELLAQLDQAMADRAPCRIYVPDLCAAAGKDERVAFEQKRYNLLVAD